MQTRRRNLYKATIFKCAHRLHRHAEKGTSVWHILKQKECYPGGCLSFRPRCEQFDRRRKCPRKKRRLEPSCASCQYFYEEKRNFQPDPVLSDAEMKRFWRELEEFEDWLGEIKDRRLEVRGKVEKVLPHLVRQQRRSITCRGILFFFTTGIIGRDIFEDPFYARLSSNVYERAQIAAGDEIDFEGQLIIDRGRLVFNRVGQIDLVRPGDAEFVSMDNFRRVRIAGSEIDGQPNKCLQCRHGLLIDDLDSDGRSRPRRLMYCLKGVADYRYCPYRES
jgi:hypothetical protein